MTDPSSKLEELLQVGRGSFSPRDERLESVRGALAAKIAALPTAAAAPSGLGHSLRDALWRLPSRWITRCLLLGVATAGVGALTLPRALAPRSLAAPSAPASPSAPATTAPAAASWAPVPSDSSPVPPLLEFVAGHRARAELHGPGAPGAGKVPRTPRSAEVGAAQTADGTLAPNETTPPTPIASTQDPEPSVATTRVEDALAGELSALRAARLALHRGDAERSLSLLDDYAAIHPRGTLQEERLATRILALCMLGRVDAARTSARSLERLGPNSPQWVAIDASCAGRGSSHDR